MRRNESEKHIETAGVFVLGASWCQPLFLVFGRFVIYRTVAKSRSESGYETSDADNLSHFFRMADRTLHRDPAAHAVTDEVRARILR